jgi:hypothetical protein
MAKPMIIRKRQSLETAEVVEKREVNRVKISQALFHLKELQWEFGYSELRAKHISTLTKALRRVSC